MTPPDKVPMEVIDSIAHRHVKWVRQGDCPRHDTYGGEAATEKGNTDYNHGSYTCTCACSMARFQDILRNLRWNFDHYSFNFAGMYVGVELDGYMHT